MLEKLKMSQESKEKLALKIRQTVIQGEDSAKNRIYPLISKIADKAINYWKKRSTKQKRIILLASFGYLCFFTFCLGAIYQVYRNQYQNQAANHDGSKQASPSATAANQSWNPYVRLSSRNSSYQGLISYSFYEEPKISVSTNQVEKRLDCSFYKVSSEDILNYFAYESKDEWGTREGSSRQINLEDKQKVATWQEKKDATDIVLPIDGAGVYFLKIEAKAPKAKDKKVSDETFIVVSQNGTLFRKDSEDYLFWSQSFKDGKSLADVELSFYNLEAEPSLIDKIKTDQQGLARIETSDRFDLIFAEKDDDFQVIPAVGFNNPYDSGCWGYQYNCSQTYRVFLYTDRPIYKPGDTVFFKGIIRLDNDALYQLPPTGTSVAVEVGRSYPENSDPIFTGDFGLDERGVLWGQIELGEEIETTNYYFNLTIGDESYSYLGGFKVADYRKPEYTLSVETDHLEYINGDTIKATISGEYFFGQPLSEKEIKYEVQTRDFYEYEGADYSYYTNHVYYHSYNDSLIDEKTVKLDKNGRAEIEIPINLGEDEKSKVYTLWAEAKDETQDPAVAGKNMLVHKGEFALFGQKNSHAVPLNDEIKVDVKALGANKELYSDIEISAEIKHSWWEEENDQYNKKENELDKESAVTNENGIASFSITPQATGSFRFRVSAKDSRGNKITNNFYFWVYDPNERTIFNQERIEGISFTSDKESYQIGETAQVYASLPGRTSQLLFSIEKSKIYEYKIIDTASEFVTLEVPIQEEYIPNIYVNLSSFIQSQFYSSDLSLAVNTEHKKINIEITPNKNKYSPRDEVQFTIKTSDNLGNPIAVDLSLALIDKAIYELTTSGSFGSNFNTDIFESFYRERGHSVRRGHSKEGIYDYGGGRGAAGGGAREHFADTAYWNPNIQTDQNGLATVNLTLPDNLTTWVAAAYASSDDTKVGQGKAEITVTKEVILRPVLPNFLMSGDELTLQAIVQNYQGKDDNFDISLASDQLDIESLNNQSAWVENNSYKTVSWNVKVKDDIDKARLTLSAKADSTSKEDSVIVELPVNIYGFETFIINSGVNEGEINIKLNPEANNSNSKVKIYLTSSLTASVPETLERLVNYPYGCIEQTTSRFVPAVIVKNNLSYLKIDNSYILDNLDTMLERGFERLSALQNDDGGWSWWNIQNADVFITSYVFESLQKLKEAGVEVPEGLFNSALEYLKKNQGSGAKTDIYSNYALSQYDPSLVKIKDYKESDLNDEEMAVYILLLKNVGKEDQAKQMAEALLNRGKKEDSQVLTWEAGSKEFFGSTEVSAAFAIRALLATGTNPDTLSPTLQSLTRKGFGNYYRSTYENVQTILTLIEYSKLTSELSPNYHYQVLLDEELLQEGDRNENNFRQTMNPIEISADRIKPEGSTFRFAKDGSGYLYYTVVVSEFNTQKDNVAKEDGLSITRSYEGLDGKESDFKVGDVVKVTLQIQNKERSNLYYFVVEDYLPSGFVPIEGDLKNQLYEEDRWYYDRNIHFDKVSFHPYSLYSTSGKKLTYLARVVSAGRFQVSPAVGYLMYNPEVYGRSDSTIITVTAD